MDLCHPSHCILRQARYSSSTASELRRCSGARRHWPDPWRLGHSCGSSFSWRLGGVCNYYPSHGDRLATRAGEPDRHGIGRSCSLLALNGHGDGDQRCLLLELKRTWVGLSEMSANDPKADIDWYPLRTAVLP